MKAFQFSLQKVLNIKEALEEAAKIQMGQALRRLEESRTILLKLQKNLNAHVVRAEKFNGVKTDSHDLAMHFTHLHWLQEQTEKQLQDVYKMEINVEKIRERLLQFVKEVKIMEKLKEKEAGRWLTDQNHKEQNEMDEMAGQIFERNLLEVAE